MAGLAVLAAAGSCQEPIEQPVVEQTPVVELEYQDVTFNVAAPSGPQTRTVYGETVTFPTELHVAVYVAKGNENPDKEGTWLKDVEPVIVPKAEGEGVINTVWEVTISLVKSYSYDIVFWAQKAESTYYTIDWENATITADYKVAANDVTRDAFYHVAKGYNYLTANEEDARIQLTRPFAQINLGASDYAALMAAGKEYLQHVHIASRGRRKMPGEDGVKDNYREGFRALKQMHYPHYVSFECGCAGKREEVVPKAVELLRTQWEEA
jgi:hypothetical protein